MKTIVLDASALLALFFDETGAGKVETLLQHAAEADKPLLITAVSWAEVLYQMQDKHQKDGAKTAHQFAKTMPLEIAAVDAELAELAVQYKITQGLGLIDACTGALAKIKKAELLTGGIELKTLENEIKITWLTDNTR